MKLKKRYFYVFVFILILVFTCVFVVSKPGDKLIRDIVNKMRNSSQEEIQAYCIGHEKFWLKMASEAPWKDNHENVNQLVERNIEWRTALKKEGLQKCLKRFRVGCRIQDEKDGGNLMLLFTRIHRSDWDPTEFWDIYYILNEKTPKSQKLREEVLKYPKHSKDQRNGYLWSFGDHWIGERVK